MNREYETWLRDALLVKLFETANPVSQLFTTQFQVKPGQKLLQIPFPYTDITIY